mgnify:FL=1
MSGTRRPRRDGARPFRPSEVPPGARAGLGGSRRAAGATLGGSTGVGARRPRQRPLERLAIALSPSARVATLLRRVAAVLLISATTLAPVPVATGSSVPIVAVTVAGAGLVDPRAIVAASGINSGGNLLAAHLHGAEVGIGALPMIASVTVRAALPGTIHIDIVERAPLLRWASNGVTYLVDGAGRVLATTDSNLLASSADRLIATLPLITDARAESTMELGGSISTALFDAVTRLISLTPSDVGSAATGVALRVDPDWGLLLTARGGPADADWVAVFGTYTSALRPPTMIPEQVRLLRSLLARGEGRFGWVILADARAGTYTDRGVVPPPAGGGSPSTTSPSSSPVNTTNPTTTPYPTASP